MTNILVKLNNWLTELRHPRVAPEELLLLIPHCLQIQSCERNVRGKLSNCNKCGTCPVGDLLSLAERYGVRVEFVSGGRKAVGAVKQPEIKAVVAVACAKELSAGIKAVFPKAVTAVCNSQPEGPCVNTQVDVAMVEQALKKMLKL